MTIKGRVIAAHLLEAAARYPDAAERDYGCDPLAEFRFGTLIIRCLPCAGAIRQVAAKYHRGTAWSTGWKRPKTRAQMMRRPTDADATLAKYADAPDQLEAVA